MLEKEVLDMGGNPESPRAGGKTEGAKSACMLILERLFCRPSDLDDAGDFCGFGVCGCALLLLLLLLVLLLVLWVL